MSAAPIRYLLEGWLDARRAEHLEKRARCAESAFEAARLRRLAATPVPHKPIALNRSVR